MRVLVLGGSGMLGSVCVKHFLSAGFEVTATARGTSLEDCQAESPGATWRAFEVGQADLTAILPEGGWVVNAIGVVNKRCGSPAGAEEAIRVNSLFPHDLARAARAVGAKVIQIATDCVFAGAHGGYVESSPHDALDVYGKTKSLGECDLEGIHHVRVSIVGPERGTTSLLGWFLSVGAGATVHGYSNHLWNGVTTLEFARVCAGVIRADYPLPRLCHLVPADIVSKEQLLRLFGQHFRPDVEVRSHATPFSVDRTLATEVPEVCRDMWRLAGRTEPPSVSEMISDLAGLAPSLPVPQDLSGQETL